MCMYGLKRSTHNKAGTLQHSTKKHLLHSYKEQIRILLKLMLCFVLVGVVI